MLEIYSTLLNKYQPIMTLQVASRGFWKVFTSRESKDISEEELIYLISTATDVLRKRERPGKLSLSVMARGDRENILLTYGLLLPKGSAAKSLV